MEISCDTSATAEIAKDIRASKLYKDKLRVVLSRKVNLNRPKSFPESYGGNMPIHYSLLACQSWATVYALYRQRNCHNIFIKNLIC